jgi:uncharacterized protein
MIAHNAEGRFVIDLHNFPEEGRTYAGTSQGDIFTLEAGGPQWRGPLEYDLFVVLIPGAMVVTGTVRTGFAMDCVRCLESFVEEIDLDLELQLELGENNAEADLTELIREDILLALPDYPHCDEASTSPRDCPAAGKFKSASDYSIDHPEDEENIVAQADKWGVLDKLKLPPS